MRAVTVIRVDSGGPQNISCHIGAKRVVCSSLELAQMQIKSPSHPSLWKARGYPWLWTISRQEMNSSLPRMGLLEGPWWLVMPQKAMYLSIVLIQLGTGLISEAYVTTYCLDEVHDLCSDLNSGQYLRAYHHRWLYWCEWPVLPFGAMVTSRLMLSLRAMTGYWWSWGLYWCP